MVSEFPILSADEAAAFIPNGAWVACSGFTSAGSVKSIPLALARRATELHQKNQAFSIHLLTGASSHEAVDGALMQAQAVTYRAPYQSHPAMRIAINQGNVAYREEHLSHFPQSIRSGIMGPLDYALVEVADYTPDGRLTLTASVGATPTFCQCAKHIILEHNPYHAPLKGVHDIYEPNRYPPYDIIRITKPNDRIGTTQLTVDPRKILGVVETYQSEQNPEFKPIDTVFQRIGERVVEFLQQEMRVGRIPQSFLPVQSGVGNIANAILKVMGTNPAIPTFQVYTEIAQDAMFDLMKQGKVSFISTCGVYVTDGYQKELYSNWSCYQNRLILRPQEISNHPEVIRRLGLLSFNSALEVDLFGNVNSTHVQGTQAVNGIGGSGDFARNSFLSVFTLQSTAKSGAISNIVPFCSHIDHTEHDTQIIVTEYGCADLRGKSPEQRAKAMIACAHPDYRPILQSYLKQAQQGHIGHNLSNAFALYQAYQATGDMRNVNF